MKIQRYESGLLRSNMYLVIEDQMAVVIDPCMDTSPAEGLKIEKIILTHEHYDHISGVNKWKEATGAPVLCSKICAEHIQTPRKNMARYFEDFCELQTWIELDEMPSFDSEYSCRADEIFNHELRLDLIGHEWYIFEMPGHSLGSIGIVVDGLFFFSGDSLMENMEINLRIPGGSRKKWEKVGRHRLAAIPINVKVYPGHFAPFVRG